jgi:hypothetical protein
MSPLTTRASLGESDCDGGVILVSPSHWWFHYTVLNC